MKLTEAQLRNLIKQELKQFLKLNEGNDTSSKLDSLDTKIPIDDADELGLYDEDDPLHVAAQARSRAAQERSRAAQERSRLFRK